MRGRAWPLVISLALLCFGCGRKPVPDGRKVFLQSEAELKGVRSFRAHMVTGEGGGMMTDAEYQCDKNIAHYLETKDNPPSKTEFIATETVLFHRSADELDAIWNAERRPANLRACTRLLDGPDRKKMGVRYFSADQERILPPFSLYATEDGRRSRCWATKWSTESPAKSGRWKTKRCLFLCTQFGSGRSIACRRNMWKVIWPSRRER